MAIQRTTGDSFFLPLLAIVFITLRLTDVIAWSWIWVLAPLWVPVAIFALIGLVAALVYLSAD